jgi:hypothetical protein
MLGARPATVADETANRLRAVGAERAGVPRALIAGKNYKAAVGPLTEAYRAIPAIPAKYDADTKVIGFKRNTPANLGIALFNLGKCDAARPLFLEARALGNAFAGSYLRRPCIDEETGKAAALDPVPPDR